MRYLFYTTLLLNIAASTAFVRADDAQPATKDSVRVAGIVLKWIRGDKDD